MKTTKEQVFEFIQKEIWSHNDNGQGIETKYIADSLQMQRSNVSAILNDLVKEEKLIKTNTRPVFYKLAEPNKYPSGSSVMDGVIGSNGSLRNAIRLGKAAVLYPQISQNVLLRSQPGCGTSYFALLLYKYGQFKGVFQKDAPYVKINCRHYAKNVSALNDDLFGADNDLSKSCFAKAKGGVLFIDNFDLLDAKQQSRIYLFLENGKIFGEDSTSELDCSDVFLILSCQPQNAMQLERRIPFVIELPELKDRPLEERFELINHFFSIEASNAKRSIAVTTESIKALLLSDFDNNVKELEYEIKSACANGYVRVVSDIDKDIYVNINDFKPQIKRNLLKLRDNLAPIEELLGNDEYIFYDKNSGYQRREIYMADIYNKIKKQYDELISRGISEQRIADVINNHIKNLFSTFKYDIKSNTINREQLSKIVDERIIELVEMFQEESGRTLGRTFPQNVFYGLCLHLNALLTGNFFGKRVSDEQINETIQKYPQEYAVSMQFAMYLNENLKLNLDTGEIVLITMFLVEQEENDQEHPVLLYIMHGNGTARSLMEVTNALTHAQNAYSYDMELSKDTKEAMEEIKSLILKIDRGKGVLVVYDMGSINTMIETISEDIDVKIRSLNIPITLFGIDIARRCAMESDIDNVFHMAKREIVRSFTKEERRNNILITLCHTGEGGAAQLKSYIDLYSNLDMKTVALSVSDRDELLKEVIELKKTGTIHAFVGTYDPKLLGIPFIPINKVFENKKEDLDRILMFEPIHTHAIDYDQIYQHLEETLAHTSIAKLKAVLPDLIDELSLLYGLNGEQQSGMFMHLACLVERMLAKEAFPYSEENIRLTHKYEEDYRLISKLLKPLEKTFKIIVDDNEIATIIRIVKRI